ncbi:MFS transporter [Saccharicrinis aurantiacus]|uniref:MFS transporter n=1 Tax=Saccharicrinis aurantiacus TaxID=1849719 RepID=UPI0009500C45|nr:MFS transporter [Saccharicrinis aurantiacus]
MKNFKLLLPSAQLLLSISLIFGTWIIYIPYITSKLNMSEGQLGAVLALGAVGSLIGVNLGKPLIRKYGEGEISFYSILFVALSSILFFIAPNLYLLGAAFIIYGAVSGSLQVASNSLIGVVERQNNVSIMSTCHGFWSVGGLISAGGGTILMANIGQPLVHISMMAALVIGIQMWFRKDFSHLRDKKKDANNPTKKKRHIAIEKPILLLSLIGVASMVSEGAIADWSGLFLRDVTHSNENIVGLGYAAFSLSMTLVRLIGDNLSVKYGSFKVLIMAFSISIVGFLLVLSANTVLSILGFAFTGIGFSVVVPEVYRIVSNYDENRRSENIAFIAGAGYVGYLVGPVLLGVIAEMVGLYYSFFVVLGLSSFGLISTLINERANNKQTKSSISDINTKPI